MAKTLVFWQDHFPVVGSQVISQASLRDALGADSSFIEETVLTRDGIPPTTDLFVMPYGSAFPSSSWANIHNYLKAGGSILVIGGQPFRVPVTSEGSRFVEGPAQDTYSRELGILHSYESPASGDKFAWKKGYSSFPQLSLHPERSFVLESRRLNGLAYLLDGTGQKVSSPVVVADHNGVLAGGQSGARYVFLDFQPDAGYWDSRDGKALIRTAARYALDGSSSFNVDLQFSTLRNGELPMVSVHLRNALFEQQHRSLTGSIQLELLSADRSVLDTRRINCSGSAIDVDLDFTKRLETGFYRVQARWQDEERTKAFYENGFWVGNAATLPSGPVLSSNGDVLSEDGNPFFPVGTNYFSTESNGWDFSGPRNAAIWDDDFNEMEKVGVNFVRTGVWGGQSKIIEGGIGGVSERFLRNVEAYILCAHRHHIAVNFTFFAFDPQSSMRTGDNPVLSLPGSNPYLDPVTIEAEKNYMLSIVNRFKTLSYLSWDLINEPSFSNPKALWHGNTPNNDPAEVNAWHSWLRSQYADLHSLATAWSVPSDQLASFDAVPLPGARDLTPDFENGTNGMARAYDYNLFAQHAFAGWVKGMVEAIRKTCSTQLIDVGQDEGGVETRVLNQFYSHSGVSFTTNHTYRQNQNLLWDSFASKTPGVPNIVGETGYQPVTYPNGNWHFDELTGSSLIESKWAAGFAAGTTGFLPWDWDREIYFGLLRSDGSAKTWIDTLKRMSQFAKVAEPFATSILRPEVAIILPQSLQLSVLSRFSLEAQQKSFLALYGYARSQAYAVGEDQIELLGSPKLIILPSPWIINSNTWDTLMGAVRTGSTLLVSGPFDLDPHYLKTSRPDQVGLPYQTKLLDTVNNDVKIQDTSETLIYGSNKTNLLQKAFFATGETFVEKSMGSGKILFSTLPLELNDNLPAVADVYKLALKEAGVKPIYSSDLLDPEMLICPTQFPEATLYVISSLTNTTDIHFRDERSGKTFVGKLDPGRSSLLLIRNNGQIIASYNWQ